MTEIRTSELWIRIEGDPLDVGAAAEFLRTDEAGGIDLFLGTTRRWTDGRETVRLDYESYRPMAIAEMQRIVAEAKGSWPIAKVCLHHREGTVPVREISVVVGVSTPHRKDAFDACRFLIDALKQRVPIWKREVYADGETQWIEGDRQDRPN